MTPINTVTSVAMPLDTRNVDTDQILPARFLKKPRSTGYGNYLFYDRRFGASGAKTDFQLNRPPYDTARILVANTSFGSGSSREGAVYALVDYGFRCIIAPSFGDIFYFNALNNGLLAIRLPEADVSDLRHIANTRPDTEFRVDLGEQTVSVGNRSFPFEIDATRKQRLMSGQDMIASTLSHKDRVESFLKSHVDARPWVVLNK